MAPDDNFPTTRNKIALAIIRMPDGREYEIALPAKTFSSGREGFYPQVPPFGYENELYGGQIQIWRKTKPKKRNMSNLLHDDHRCII